MMTWEVCATGSAWGVGRSESLVISLASVYWGPTLAPEDMEVAKTGEKKTKPSCWKTYMLGNFMCYGKKKRKYRKETECRGRALF